MQVGRGNASASDGIFRSHFIGGSAVRQRFVWTQTESSGFADDISRGRGVGLRSRRRGDAQHFVVAGNQVAVFVQVADDLLGGLAHFAAQAQRTQLPGQMVRQISRLGEEIFE